MKKKSPTKKAKPGQKIRAAHWKRSKTIDQEKYAVVSKAILKSLGSKGMRWGVLTDAVADLLPNFEGSVWWYTIACLRELETQGKVKRDLGPPVLYSKAKKASL